MPVATPPITDADAGPLFAATELLLDHALDRASTGPRHTINTVAAQDASLPSPRLSPTLAAAQLHSPLPEDDGEDETQDTIYVSRVASRFQSPREESPVTETSVDVADGFAGPLDPRDILQAFDLMSESMKSFMMYEFLRRCQLPTLRMIAGAIDPTLRRDFLKKLPLELSHHVLKFLDHRDLCRAARVSRHWRHIIDTDETVWKDLFDRDGFHLPAGELQRAIAQGWAWQDPDGIGGSEIDLSSRSHPAADESAEFTPPRRSSKRKRAHTKAHHGRSKRRASGQEPPKDAKPVGTDRSEGPMTAASAAAAAVPDPQIGVPSLRKLHLFKSLYRRHYMIRKSWLIDDVQPKHIALAAHPRHVITCLQFDDDKLITGSDDTFIHIYDTQTGRLRRRLTGHEGGVWALQYVGLTLVSGSTDRTVRVWNLESGRCSQVFHGHTSTVRCLQILRPYDTGRMDRGQKVMSPSKPLIITGSRDSQLRVWRLPDPKRHTDDVPEEHGLDGDNPYFVRTLAGHSHSVRAIAAHGDTLVSGSYDSTVRIWRISTGECLHVLEGHTQKVYSVVLDMERGVCISGSMDSAMRIWDLSTGACINTLEGHTSLVGLLDMRQGKLVSAAADSTLRVWEPVSGKCKSTLVGHTGAITCFQHDGEKVISGSEKTVKMWNIQTGECMRDLLTDLGSVWQVKFDGRRCVAAVQRDTVTYIEILDFGAVRDGTPPGDLGRRILLNEEEVSALVEEEI